MEAKVDLTFGALGRHGSICSALVALCAVAQAQEPISATLGPIDPYEIYLPRWLDSSFGPRAFDFGTNQSDVVSTRRGGQLRNDYGTWESHGVLELPFTIGRLPAELKLKDSSLLANGSYYDSDQYIKGRGEFAGLDGALTVQISPRDVAQLALEHDQVSALLHNSYLAGTFDLYGDDPDAAWRRDQTRVGLGYERRLSANWDLGGAVESDVVGSTYSAQNPDGPQSLALPAGAAGGRYSLAVRHRVTRSVSADLYGETEDSDGKDLIRRETGEQVGRGTTFERSRAFGMSAVRSLSSGGKLRLNYDNMAASTEYSGLIYNAQDAGIDADSNTLVGYDALLKNRRSEVGFQWNTPQGRRRSLELGYRQVWLQDIAIGDYAASLFIFGVQGSSSVSYPHVQVGVLDVDYTLPVRALDLRLEARQIIPYHLQDSQPSNGGSSSGGGSGPSTLSSGGWTLGAELSYRF